MLTRTFIILLLAFPAYGQDASLRYSIQPDLATAQALSAAAWAAVRCTPQPSCDAAQVTQFVYSIQGLTNGKYAIVIHSGDVYQGEHLSLPNGKSFDLTAGQIASLQTRSQIGVLLADILPIALVNSRATAQQITAINNYANAHASFKTNYTLLISGPIDLQNPLTNTVFNELQQAGILTASDVATILAPQAVAGVTQ